MKEHINELAELLSEASVIIESANTVDFRQKLAPDKWSKQEILGHLIDSAVNNLQRFTECLPSNEPYIVSNYNQDLLVRTNGYQQADKAELLSFWLAINRRIGHVMDLKSEEELGQQVLLPTGSVRDLRFLMTDYIEHLKYHLTQITGRDYPNTFSTSNYIGD